ncbi:hypothetical protein IWX92DRAFT_383224 [Phyllosticta citricarpa]
MPGPVCCIRPPTSSFDHHGRPACLPATTTTPNTDPLLLFILDPLIFYGSVSSRQDGAGDQQRPEATTCRQWRRGRRGRGRVRHPSRCPSPERGLSLISSAPAIPHHLPRAPPPPHHHHLSNPGPAFPFPRTGHAVEIWPPLQKKILFLSNIWAKLMVSHLSCLFAYNSAPSKLPLSSRHRLDFWQQAMQQVGKQDKTVAAAAAASSSEPPPPQFHHGPFLPARLAVPAAVVAAETAPHHMQHQSTHACIRRAQQFAQQWWSRLPPYMNDPWTNGRTAFSHRHNHVAVVLNRCACCREQRVGMDRVNSRTDWREYCTSTPSKHATASATPSVCECPSAGTCLVALCHLLFHHHLDACLLADKSNG